MNTKHTRRGFTQIKRVGQALPDNAPAKGHTAAFTLIELLVVVLIIGILATVAVPQYQKAVYKSRATEALTMLKAIVQAQEVYYLANNEYTNDIGKLDVEVPSDLIRINGEEFPEKNYKYYCTIQYCAANIGNANMPAFDFSMVDGTHLCHLTSGNSKNENAKSICLSMGGTPYAPYEKYNWAKGKYFIIN